MKTKLFIPLIATPLLFGCANKLSAQALAAPAQKAVAPLEEVAQNTAKAARAVASTSAAVATLSRSSAYSDNIPPVLVNFSSVDSKNAEELEEDLTIFGHLIDKAMNNGLGADAPDSALGIEMLYTGGGRSIRGMYIEGSGALFMIKVGFPLMGPAPTEEKQKENAPNSEWQAAREELLKQTRGISEGPVRVGRPFDPKQVDALQKVLLNEMKNGANLRHLKKDETVSLAVFGYPAPVRGYTNKGDQKSSSPRAGNYYRTERADSAYGVGVAWSGGSSYSQKGTVLTIKAKKSDIEDFANGKTDLDQFSKKVTTTRYAGNGYGVTSVNSWVQETPSPRYQLR